MCLRIRIPYAGLRFSHPKILPPSLKSMLLNTVVKCKQCVGVRLLRDISISAKNKSTLLLDVRSEVCYIQQQTIGWPLNQCRFVKSSTPYGTGMGWNLARRAMSAGVLGDRLKGWEKKGGEKARIKGEEKNPKQNNRREEMECAWGTRWMSILLLSGIWRRGIWLQKVTFPPNYTASHPRIQ